MLTNLRRSHNPEGLVHTPSPDHITTIDEAQTHLRLATIAQFLATSLLRNVADAEDWSLTGPQKKTLTRGHLKDIGSTMGIRSYP